MGIAGNLQLLIDAVSIQDEIIVATPFYFTQTGLSIRTNAIANVTIPYTVQIVYQIFA